MNRSEVLTLIRKVGNRWPNWRIPTDPAELVDLVGDWLIDLEHVDLEHAIVAVRLMSQEGESWPPPLGRIATEGLRLGGHRVPPTAEEAWLEVEDQFGRTGYYGGAPSWSHPAVKEGVGAVGGFRGLCQSETPMADRAHFLRLYPAIRAWWLREDCTPPTLRDALEPAAVAALGSGGDRWEQADEPQKVAVEADRP